MSGGDRAGALVCGFYDLAAGLGGLGWDLRGTGGLLMSDGAVTGAEAEITANERDLELKLTAEKAEVEATLSPRAGTIPLRSPNASPPPGGALEAATCMATVRSAGGGRTLQCRGHLTRWAGDPLEGAGTLRHLAVERGDGSLLLVAARGDAGLAGHGDEQAGGWLLDGEGGSSAFAESLISTQYDAEGRMTRAGLELWPQGEEEAMIRSAATRAAATSLGGIEKEGVSAALLRCMTEGAEGLGSYLLWRG
jgi:hypothetical protein